MREVANKPSTNPVREVEDIAEFRSCAPGLPIYKLGGGLMKECVNLEIKNGRLKSRDKLKMFASEPDLKQGGTENASVFYDKFFSITYNGVEEKFWYAIVHTGTQLWMWERFFRHNGSAWEKIYEYTFPFASVFIDLLAFKVFRMNNLFNTSFWIVSTHIGRSFVLDMSTMQFRPLGMQNVQIIPTQDTSTGQSNRAFGFDYVEKIGEIVIRSSGVKKLDGLVGTTRGLMNFLVPGAEQTPPRTTHIRLWLSDKLFDVENEEEFSGDPNVLYPVIDFELNELRAGSMNGANGVATIDRRKGLNGILFSVYRYSQTSFRVVYYESLDSQEPSFTSIENSTIETMNLIPMPDARCLSNGTIFGIMNDNVVYSSNPGTVFQEQTTALKVLVADVGSIIDIVPVSTGTLAFGSKGIARVASLGGGDFSVSKIASRDLTGMRCSALPGLGAVCVGTGKFIFVNENTFEASEEFMGLPIADMLGDLANDVRAVKIADNKLYIIAGDGNNAENNRLFFIDLDSGAMMEIKTKYYPMDLFSTNSSIYIIGKYHGNVNRQVVVASSGEAFEENIIYAVTFCESSAYGFVQHLSTQVLAKLGKCQYLEATVKDSPRHEPNEFSKLKNGEEYQDYFIPANQNDKGNSSKAVEVTLYFGKRLLLINPEGENDGLEILSVKLTRLRQNEVSSPSFNSNRG